MGVTQILGKLFGGGDKEAVLRAYGKLPFYAEYRRLELAPGVPTLFSQWLDAGRLAWMRTGENEQNRQVRPARVVLRFPEQRECIVGCIWDSRDSLGRRFPFAFFITCAPESLGNDLLDRWLSIGAIHRLLERTFGEVHALGSGGDFYRRFQKRPVPLRIDDHAERRAALEADLAQLSAADWLAALTPDVAGEPTAADRAACTAAVARRVRRWQSQPAALAEIGCGLPLAAQQPHSVQVAAWLRFIEQLAPQVAQPPSVILPLPTDPPAPAFYLLARPLMPEDFALVTTDAEQYTFVEHVGRSAQPGSEGEPAPPPADGALLDWLHAAARPAPAGEAPAGA